MITNHNMEYTRRRFLYHAGTTVAATSMITGAACGGPEPVQQESTDSMAWWHAAKFGMFIHWGLYSIPAGIWKGRETDKVGEWIQLYMGITADEYEQLAEKFNPVKFDAREWVQIAKDAGMKYMIITAKHHDGFCLFDTELTDFNIVDATPFGRDVMQELSDACRDASIKLCFYYSIADWHHPEYPIERNQHRNGYAPNGFHGRPNPNANLSQYVAYMKGQVRELLENYPDIGIIWFDGGSEFTEEENLELLDAREIADMVRAHGALVNSRLSETVCDYRSMGDNQIPAETVDTAWETPATFNDTWGYKTTDTNWKTTRDLFRRLVHIVSKGGNYLLNVGPTGEGVIPAESVSRLREIGDWFRINGDAVYGTSAGPYPYDYDWGGITAKGHLLNLLVMQWPGAEFVLYGLKNQVKSAWLPAVRNQKLEFTQEYDRAKSLHVLRIQIPEQAPDSHVSVIVLDVDGKPEMPDYLMQQPDGSVQLDARCAELVQPKTGSELEWGRLGTIDKWQNDRQTAVWEFKMYETGEYEVRVISQLMGQDWPGGQTVRVEIGDAVISGILEDHERRENPRAPTHVLDVVSNIGVIRVDDTGMCNVTFRMEKKGRPGLFRMRGIELVQVG